MRTLPLALALALSGPAALSLPAVAAGSGPESPAHDDAAQRFDGSSAEAFSDSLASLEAGMGDAAKLGLHMKLAQVRAKLAEQRGRPLTDQEFAAALDGRTLAELDALAEAAPTHITIDIETSDDT